MRNTLSLRPATSLSNSSRPTRSKGECESFKLHDDLWWKSLPSSDVPSEALSSGVGKQLVAIGGRGELRNTLSSRPATSLSNSKRPTRSMGGAELKRRAQVSTGSEPSLGVVLGVPVMVVSEMIEQASHFQVLYHPPPKQDSSKFTTRTYDKRDFTT